jgi:hypothetical protein
MLYSHFHEFAANTAYSQDVEQTWVYQPWTVIDWHTDKWHTEVSSAVPLFSCHQVLPTNQL